MQIGDKSEAVKALQANLNKALGVSTVPVTGDYANVTEAAVRAFQQLAGLPVTGVADDATVKALEAKVITSATQTTDKKTQAIALLNQAIALLKEA